jgi:hypothetical protein
MARGDWIPFGLVAPLLSVGPVIALAPHSSALLWWPVTRFHGPDPHPRLDQGGNRPSGVFATRITNRTSGNLTPAVVGTIRSRARGK